MTPVSLPAQLRRNRRLARRMGYGKVPADHTPEPAEPRSVAEVRDRLLALHVVVTVAHGAEPSMGLRALSLLGVEAALRADEEVYLEEAATGVRVEDGARRCGIEAVAVLGWALDVLPEPALDAPADPEVIADVLPALGTPPSDEFERAELRPASELHRLRDLYWCATWGLRADPDLAVGHAPGAVEPYVAWERHGALEWLHGA